MFFFVVFVIFVWSTSIHLVIKAIYALCMHVHTNDVVISQSNSIANSKRPFHDLTRPSMDAFCSFGQ